MNWKKTAYQSPKKDIKITQNILNNQPKIFL